MAVSADGARWFLLNASPDVRDQLGRLPAREPPASTRHLPVEGIVLTDAEIDHTLGIVLLREAGRLQVCATRAVCRVLERDSCILPVTRAFAELQVTELPLDGTTTLCDRAGTTSGLTIDSFAVPGGPPRFAQDDLAGHTIGLVVRDDATGGSCAFVPGCGDLDPDLMSRLGAADLVLFDGTFWTDDELIALGIGDRRARQIDHLPIFGPGGSLEKLAALPSRSKVYTHINNTNPMLVEDSPEHALVERLGIRVGADGMRFTL